MAVVLEAPAPCAAVPVRAVTHVAFRGHHDNHGAGELVLELRHVHGSKFFLRNLSVGLDEFRAPLAVLALDVVVCACRAVLVDRVRLPDLMLPLGKALLPEPIRGIALGRRPLRRVSQLRVRART